MHKKPEIITLECGILDDNQRLDKFICDNLDFISRNLVKDLIKRGCVKKEGNTVMSPSAKTEVGQVYEIEMVMPEKASDNIQPNPAVKFEIVYEDEYLIVINKPAGVTTHPGVGNYTDTLVNGLMHHCKGLSDINDDPQRPGIVHRLDKDTSGLMVIAKTNKAHIHLAAQLHNRSLSRIYQALVHGIPNPETGVIETYIARDPKNRLKMCVAKYDGKLAITEYETKEIFARGKVSLVECKLYTGRTHQIRVHLSHIGNSVLGDQTYGKNEHKLRNNFVREIYEKLSKFGRQALHAGKIGFIHPETEKYMEFTKTIPDDMSYIIELISRC